MNNKTSLFLLVGGIGCALVLSWLVFPGESAEKEQSGLSSDVGEDTPSLRARTKLKEYDPKRAMELHRAIKTRGIKNMRAPGQTKATNNAGENRYDAYLITALGMPALASAPTQDTLGKEGPRVDLAHEGGKWVRATVDLDRDGTWDEKWSTLNGTVRRQVSTADNNTYDKEVHFIGGVWTLPPGSGLPAATSATQKTGMPAKTAE